jgi:hypothetical protein
MKKIITICILALFTFNAYAGCSYCKAENERATEEVYKQRERNLIYDLKVANEKAEKEADTKAFRDEVKSTFRRWDEEDCNNGDQEACQRLSQ